MYISLSVLQMFKCYTLPPPSPPPPVCVREEKLPLKLFFQIHLYDALSVWNPKLKGARRPVCFNPLWFNPHSGRPQWHFSFSSSSFSLSRGAFSSPPQFDSLWGNSPRPLRRHFQPIVKRVCFILIGSWTALNASFLWKTKEGSHLKEHKKLLLLWPSPSLDTFSLPEKETRTPFSSCWTDFKGKVRGESVWGSWH